MVNKIKGMFATRVQAQSPPGVCMYSTMSKLALTIHGIVFLAAVTLPFVRVSVCTLLPHCRGMSAPCRSRVVLIFRLIEYEAVLCRATVCCHPSV